MAIRTVVTRGYGNGTFNGTIKDVVLRGFSIAIVVWSIVSKSADGWGKDSPPADGWSAGSEPADGWTKLS